MEYKWDSSDLRRDYQEINKRLTSENNPRERERIERILSVIKRFIVNEELQVNDASLTCIGNAIIQEPIFRDYTKYIESLHKETPTITNLRIRKRIRFSWDELIDLNHELMMTFPQKPRSEFEKMERQDRHLRLEKKASDRKGSTIRLSGTNKQYVTLNYDEDDLGLDSFYTLAHEYGHCFGNLINDSEDSLFTEIESTFYELIAQDFSCERFIGTKEPIKIMTGKYIEEWNEAEEILKQIYYGRELFDEGLPRIDDYEAIKERKIPKQLFKTFKEGLGAKFDYTLSFLVAVELFEIYKQDKERAFYLLEQILDGTSKCELERMTTIVTPGKSLKKYKERITKQEK